MSESAKIGRGKRQPSRQRYKLELREQKNRRLRAEKRAKHPQVEHPLRGLARAKRRGNPCAVLDRAKQLNAL